MSSILEMKNSIDFTLSNLEHKLGVFVDKDIKELIKEKQELFLVHTILFKFKKDVVNCMDNINKTIENIDVGIDKYKE